MASPRDVPTYDHKPEMSAREAAAAFVGAWREERPRFGIINFANADMVGHTGVIAAAVRRSRRSTSASARWSTAVHEAGGACVVTADHGNADHMLEPDGSPNTAHSLNPVPLIVTSRRTPPARGRRHPRGRRADRARAARDRAAAGDDRAVADRGSLDFRRRLCGRRMTPKTTIANRAARRTWTMAFKGQRGTGASGFSRRLLAGLFISAGINHFVNPRAYERIVPPRLQGDAASGRPDQRRGGDRGRRRRAASERRAALGAVSDRPARGGVPGEPVHGANARALSTRSPAGRCMRGCRCSR